MIKLMLHLLSVMKKDDFQSERFHQIMKEIKLTWSPSPPWYGEGMGLSLIGHVRTL